MVLHVVGPGDDPVAAAWEDGLEEPHLKRLQSLRIASLPAARLVADTRDGDRIALTWIAHRRQIFRLTGMSRVRDWPRDGAVLERAAATFRPLAPADRDRIVEDRLRIRPARGGETLRQVLARGGSTWDVARTAVANGTTGETTLQSGWPVKVPVGQRYGRGRE